MNISNFLLPFKNFKKRIIYFILTNLLLNPLNIYIKLCIKKNKLQIK